MAEVTTVGSVIQDDIIADPNVPLLTQGVTLLTTQGELARGSVIGIITASGKGQLCDANASDGSEVGAFVLAETIDTDSGDVMATCYKSGSFVKDKMVYGTNGAPTAIESQLRDVGIHLIDAYDQI